jgi:hypothetical protein
MHLKYFKRLKCLQRFKLIVVSNFVLTLVTSVFASFWVCCALLLTFLLGAQQAQGALLYPLDELKAIEAPIAQQGLTRITVKGDRILNIFGLAQEYVLETDEDQGQIFIHPHPLNKAAIHLTLTTEGGKTQDLRLIPQDKSPEALILVSSLQEGEWEGGLQAHQGIKNEFFQEKRAKKDPASPTRDEVESLLEACQAGRIPLGYKPEPLPLSTLHAGPHLLVQELQGDTLRGLTYEIHNNTKEPLILSEPEFAGTWAETGGEELNDLIAILMPQKVLNPGERSLVHVVAKKQSR